MKARYTLAAAIGAALLSAGGARAGTLITGAKIKDGTVTGRDIKDGSLLAADFKAGQLPAGRPGRDGVNGRDGAAGAPGAAGPAASGTPKVTALPDIAMKPDDPTRSVATVGAFPYRMFCNKGSSTRSRSTPSAAGHGPQRRRVLLDVQRRRVEGRRRLRRRVRVD